jgi:hypothetical protein
MKRYAWGRTHLPAAAPLLTAALMVCACAQEPAETDEMPAVGGRLVPQVATEAPPTTGPGTADAAPWPEAVVREVLAMEQADERVRETIASLIQSAPQDTAALRRAAAEQDRVDEVNATRLQAIIREHGWPARSEVGPEAATAAFLIVQHADHDVAFQKEYLAFLEQEHARGQAPGEAVAQLADLTRLAEGRPQLYGTQVDILNGQLVVAPLEDEAGVDRRRATLGLGPLAEYIARVKQAYGIPE